MKTKTSKHFLQITFFSILFSLNCLAQSTSVSEDIIFLNQQMSILKIDTSGVNIKRMQVVFDKQKEISKGFIYDFFGDNIKFDTLRIAKLLKAMYTNKYAEVIGLSNKIYPHGIFEIERLVAFSRTIAYAHLNKPYESMMSFNSKTIKESLQSQSAIFVHGKNHNLDFDKMNLEFLKKKRRENNREAGILLGFGGAMIAGTALTIYAINQALKDWNFNMF